jgi:hypothetical protein
VHFDIGLLGTSAAIGGSQIFNVHGNRSSVNDRVEVKTRRRSLKVKRRIKRGLERNRFEERMTLLKTS